MKLQEEEPQPEPSPKHTDIPNKFDKDWINNCVDPIRLRHIQRQLPSTHFLLYLVEERLVLLADGPSKSSADLAASCLHEANNLFLRSKDYVKAIELYSQCVAVAPSTEALTNRARVYLAQKMHSKAETDADRALCIDPKCSAAFQIKARVHAALGKFSLALAEIKACIILNPGDTTVSFAQCETP